MASTSTSRQGAAHGGWPARWHACALRPHGPASRQKRRGALRGRSATRLAQAAQQPLRAQPAIHASLRACGARQVAVGLDGRVHVRRMAGLQVAPRAAQQRGLPAGQAGLRGRLRQHARQHAPHHRDGGPPLTACRGAEGVTADPPPPDAVRGSGMLSGAPVLCLPAYAGTILAILVTWRSGRRHARIS